MKNQTNETNSGKYLIVEQNTLACEMLSSLIYDINNYDCVVYESQSIKKFEKILISDSIDNIIIGSCGSDSQQLALIERARAYRSQSKIMVFVNPVDTDLSNRLLSSDVCILVTVNSPHSELVTALRSLKYNQRFICQSILENRSLNNQKTQSTGKTEDNKLKHTKLTKRQKDVLQHIISGHANKRIAYELGVCEGTVKLHVSSILKLLNVSNRTKAALVANQYFGGLYTNG